MRAAATSSKVLSVAVRIAGFTNLALHPQVERLIRSEVDKANVELARVEQIKTFRILPKARCGCHHGFRALAQQQRRGLAA